MVASKVFISDWVIDQEKTQDHWLEVKSNKGVSSAVVKRDGCIDYNRHYPGNRDDDPDYLHICDIDEEINRLIALKVLAQEFFGEEWPNL